jgi:hypothetical protein
MTRLGAVGRRAEIEGFSAPLVDHLMSFLRKAVASCWCIEQLIMDSVLRSSCTACIVLHFDISITYSHRASDLRPYAYLLFRITTMYHVQVLNPVR